jgi:hypothetical protein
LALFEKPCIIENQHRIALARQGQHAFHALLIECVGIPLHGCEQPLELLFARAGDDRRQRITVLARMVGQEAREIALQGGLAFPPTKLHVEGLQEISERWERIAGSPW